MPVLLDRVDQLILEGQSLRDQWRDQFGPPENDREERARLTTRWLQSSEHFLDFANLLEFKKQFAEIKENEKSYPAYLYSQLLGILESARDEIKAGFVGRLVFLVHAEFFGSVLEQADELLDKGHTTPAAVLARIVIESWLRDEAQRNGLSDYETAKASVLNNRLKEAGIFPVARWRLIQGYLDVGNAAAHGKVDEFKATDVEQALAFARSNCV